MTVPLDVYDALVDEYCAQKEQIRVLADAIVQWADEYAALEVELKDAKATLAVIEALMAQSAVSA